MNLDKNRVGLVVGSFAGLAHLVWSVLVALGWAQGWVDFIYSIHFLNNPFQVASFDLVKAATLIVVTGLVGYIVGYVFAGLWEYVAKRK